MSLSHKNTQSKSFSNNLQNGFTFPLVALFVAAFLIIPLGFWVANENKDISDQVMGATSTNNYQGTVVKIISKTNSWDLYQYLCKSLDECKGGLTSGKKWETTHGGITAGTNVLIGHDNSFNDYEYVKIFVKQGSISTDMGVGSEYISRIADTDVLFIPVKQLEQSTYQSFLFTAK